MAIAKRVFLFLTVNVLIVLTISILLNLLNIRPYLTAQGIDYGQLLAFCFIWGMGGAFISLALSRVIAKWSMGVKIIDPANPGQFSELVVLVHRLAGQTGIARMPQVGIYQSPEVNAFATGPTKNRALVAVSAGLLSRMDRAQIEGVLGHEVSHVANGDMVTMTLIQGIVNAFVMFLARVIAFAVTQGSRDENRYATTYMITFLLEIVLGMLGFIVVAAFSRWREYRADAGGARLTGTPKMIGALQALKANYDRVETSRSASLQSLKINNRRSGFAMLFSTHPPLDDRIARLQTL